MSRNIGYNFGSKGYHAQFGNLPAADPGWLRKKTAEYIETKLDRQSWYSDPVVTTVCGKVFDEGTKIDTVDAFQRKNGAAINAPSHVVDVVLGHIKNFVPKETDLRVPLRAIDLRFMTDLAPEIIGNQCVDFEKQDGITEIDEAIQANKVEQRMNDQLYAAEQDGDVVIRRNPVFIGCVSNFSNFLDLCRKTIRHLELGVPCVVFSRSNCGQHCFRWFKLLDKMLAEYNVEPGMLSFLSCSIEEQRRVMSACPESPMHFTGSREIASKIKEVCPKLMASTGGPNTLIATQYSDEVGDALRMSNCIENKGQCTAARHFVLDARNLSTPLSSSDVKTKLDKTYGGTPCLKGGLDAIKSGDFAAALSCQATPKDPAYEQLACGVNVKIRDKLPLEIEEKWRQLYLDVTLTPNLQDKAFLLQLSKWLNEKQPISVAMNSNDYALADWIFETTGVVVYTVGSIGKPALTAQARPQDGEIFGEFPPRKEMSKVSYLPMLVPSPAAAYNSIYSESLLQERGCKAGVLEGLCIPASKILRAITDKRVIGYASLILEYLIDACGPKVGGTGRTALYGLQRPPMDGSKSVIRCESNNNMSRLLLYSLVYIATNAWDNITLSVGSSVDQGLLKGLMGNTPVFVEDNATFARRCVADNAGIYAISKADDPLECMLAGQFCSRLFPLGHIKSVLPNDTKFIDHFKQSKKWLKMRVDEAYL